MNSEFRTSIVTFISEKGNDEELLQLAAEIKARRSRENTLESELGNYIGVNRLSGKPRDTTPAVPVSAVEPQAPQKKPVTPPGTATSRMGADTKALIQRHLSKGPCSAQELSVVIKRNLTQTHDLLKRLWEKKEVTYDGDSYILNKS